MDRPIPNCSGHRQDNTYQPANLENEQFRAEPRARALFMDILRQPRGITHELRRMHRYGILAAAVRMSSGVAPSPSFMALPTMASF